MVTPTATKVNTGAFHGSKHLLEDLFGLAARCYELLVLTLDVWIFAEFFGEQFRRRRNPRIPGGLEAKSREQHHNHHRHG